MLTPIGPQCDSDVNPYETPGIDRLHHTSVYIWPLPSEKKIVLELKIDDAQLGKSIRDTNRYVVQSRWGTFFFSMGFLWTGAIWTSNGGVVVLFLCASFFVGLCVTVPRCSVLDFLGAGLVLKLPPLVSRPRLLSIIATIAEFPVGVRFERFDMHCIASIPIDCKASG